jgi:tetratricopeptide (TPR) repeat protein
MLLLGPAYPEDGIGAIVGNWNNESGWNMHVTRDDFGGYDASLGCCGDGRITADTTVKGANIKLEGSNWECWYNANILSDRATMNWRLIRGTGKECDTAKGFFYLKNDNTKVSDAIARGNDAYALRDYDRAIAEYSEAIHLDHYNALAFSNRAAARSAKQDYDASIADYSDAIRLQPDQANYYANRCFTYISQKNYTRAVADGSDAIRLDPQRADGFICRGDAYFASEAYVNAIRDYDEAIRLRPNNANYINRRNNARYEARLFSFQICNQTQRNAYIATAGVSDPGSTTFYMTGWFAVPPLTCKPIGRFLISYGVFWVGRDEYDRWWTGNWGPWCLGNLRDAFKIIVNSQGPCNADYLKGFIKTVPAAGAHAAIEAIKDR